MDYNSKFDLIEAVRDNDHNRLERLIYVLGAAQIQATKSGESNLLCLAVGNVTSVKLLLDVGIDVNETNENGMTPFHLAASGDFSESLLQMVLHGAEINEKTNPPDETTGKTALDLAIENNSRSCMDLLLFCGADTTDLLDTEKYENQSVILYGYKERKIRCGGVSVGLRAMVDVMNTQGEKVGIAIKSTSVDFDIFLRSLPDEFQSSSIHVEKVDRKDGEDLVTDIYQYRVNKNVTCDVIIPIVTSEGQDLNRYQEYVVRQSCQEGRAESDEGTVVMKQQNMLCIRDLQLYAYGTHPVVGFGVFVKNKVQRVTLDPTKEQTITSEVDAKFQITVPPGGMGTTTKVEMEVMKIEQTPNTQESGESGTHTDFCTVRDASEETKVKTIDDDSDSYSDTEEQTKLKFILKLPAPSQISEEIPKVVGCSEGNSGEDPDSWEVKTGAILDASQSCMNVPDAEKGSYIVVAVRKVGYWLKEYVRTLYEKAVGTKVDCVLFAAIQRLDTAFLVNVILTDRENKKQYVEQYRKTCFVQDDMETAIQINKKYEYRLKLQCHRGKVLSEDKLPVKYQGSQVKVNTFTVSEKHGPIGAVLVFKKTIPKNLEQNLHKMKGRLLFYYKPGDICAIPQDEFPSDRFLDKLNEKLGENWFEIGIRLGLSCEVLSDLETSDPRLRNKRILRQWRGEYFENLDNALDSLFAAFTKSERPDLTRYCQEEILRIIQNPNNEHLKTWIKKYALQEEVGQRGALQRQYSYDSLDVPDSPLEENNGPFLFNVVKKLPPDSHFIFLEMGLSEWCLKEMRLRRCPTGNKLFQLLVEVKRRESSPVKFLQTLLKALKKEKLNFAREEIQSLVETWLDKQTENIDQRQRKEIIKLFK